MSPSHVTEDVADLEIISYEKLRAGDTSEAQRLLSACQNWGFFYLDLQTQKDANYLDLVRELFDISRKYFAMPLDQKIQDTNQKREVFNICGYKPMGLDSGNVEHKKDGCEGLRVPVDLVFNPEARPEISPPRGIRSNWDSVENFIRESFSISILILSTLSAAFSLEGEDSFEAKHKANGCSSSTAVLQHYPLSDLPSDTSVGHFTHTDTGSITILFNTEWGLQVYSDIRHRWEYVAPRKGHAIINLGDSLKFLSHLKLKSCLHRVVPSPERWTSGSRYALIFFHRPNNRAEFVDLEGGRWTAEDWLNSKFQNYRAPLQEQRFSTMATGKKGFLGTWNAFSPCEETSAILS